MEQFEKVEKGLEVHIKPNSRCVGCPYPNNGMCGDQLYSDALALIRQQQERIKELEEAHVARVMLKDEVSKQHNPLNDGCVWLERKGGGIVPVFLYALEYGKLYVFSLYYPLGPDCVMNDAETFICWWNIACYGEKWRCWTQRPTDEQRKAVQWNE